MAHFYLGPWLWQTGPLSHWRPPAGCLTSLDLRPLPAQAAAGPTPQGFGFFVQPVRLPDETGYDYLGSDPDLVLSAAQRNAWKSRLGLAAVPAGPQLKQVLYQTLTVHADPQGTVLCPPLLPDRSGILRLNLGGFSFARRLQRADPEWPNVRDRLQLVYRRIRELVLAGQCRPDQHRRLLSVWLEQFHLTGAADYRDFIPGDMPDEGPVSHETVITENFNTADSDTLGPNLTWTELAGDIDVASNKARVGVLDTDSIARADSDLSSTDPYAQGVIGASEETLIAAVGTIARKDGTATMTYYLGQGRFDNNTVNLFKCVSGTYTQIGSDVSATLTAGTTYLLRLECNGSTLRVLLDGVEKINQTDTAITSGLRCGMRQYKSVLGYVEIDDFEAGDLAAAGTRPWPPRIIQPPYPAWVVNQ